MCDYSRHHVANPWPAKIEDKLVATKSRHTRSLADPRLVGELNVVVACCPETLTGFDESARPRVVVRHRTR